jgi:hypothetical protein
MTHEDAQFDRDKAEALAAMDQALVELKLLQAQLENGEEPTKAPSVVAALRALRQVSKHIVRREVY